MVVVVVVMGMALWQMSVGTCVWMYALLPTACIHVGSK